MDTLKVFISGTMDDLREERQVVAEAIEAIGGLEWKSVMAESYGSQPYSSREACRRMVEECAIYLGVYGHRYGWVIPDEAISVTEMEYQEAQRLGKPTLIYVKAVPRREPEQEAFLRRVQDFDTGFFRRPLFENAAQLAAWIQEDLPNLVTRIVAERHRAETPLPLRPPAPPRHFVGRAAQIKELRRMLGGGGTAVISGAVAKLVGMGGLGKTALAAYAAQELATEFPDGVLWAELHRSSTEDILTAIAGFYHLDLSRCPDRATKAAAVRGVLEKKRALLVLDNAQHNEQLKPFQMGAGARCAVLVTTRRDDLAALRHAQRVGLPLLSEGEALDLLRGIAGPARVEAEPEVAEEILAMVGYLPLAVDIVASRLRDRPEWSLGETQRRLADSSRRMEELELGDDYGVRLSFDMSHEALKPEEQRFFAWMGVFGGVDFDVTAAAVVAQVEERKAERTLERLRHLALAQPGRRAGRYALHPLLRDYACAHLDDQDAYRRMAAHYLAVAREAGSKLTGREIEDGLAVLDEEISNVRAGQAWTAKGDDEKAQALTRDYMDEPIFGYFMLRAHWDEWIEWSQTGLRACEELGDEYGAAVISGNLGNVYMQKGEWERAIEFYQKGLQIFEKVGDIHKIAKVYFNIGEIYFWKGDLRQAIAAYEGALETFGNIGDKRGIAMAYANLGNVYDEQSNWDRAIDSHINALKIMEEIGDLRVIGIIYDNLGTVYRHTKTWEKAIEFYHRSLEVKQECGDNVRMATTYGNLGRLYADKGEPEQALQFYRKDLEISEKVGNIQGMAQTWANLGLLYEEQGDFEKALDYLERALDVFQRLGSHDAKRTQQHVERVRGKAVGKRISG